MGWLFFLFSVLILFFIGQIRCVTDIIVEQPFYLRARIHDSQSATVQFEIARDNAQRSCQRYKFMIRRNHDYFYAMPEQNLTFWRNTLELKHLSAGRYRICAIICSEYLVRSLVPTHEVFRRKNHSIPIETCVHIRAYRSHFLVLTLYILVFIFLAFSQMIFTFRKRKFRARITSTLMEIENSLQKHLGNQSTPAPHTYSILQTLVTNPALPVTDQSISFHLDFSSESPITTNEIP